jgi:hypothetical protein
MPARSGFLNSVTLGSRVFAVSRLDEDLPIAELVFVEILLLSGFIQPSGGTLGRQIKKRAADGSLNEQGMKVVI